MFKFNIFFGGGNTNHGLFKTLVTKFTRFYPNAALFFYLQKKNETSDGDLRFPSVQEMAKHQPKLKSTPGDWSQGWKIGIRTEDFTGSFVISHVNC